MISWKNYQDETQDTEFNITSIKFIKELEKCKDDTKKLKPNELKGNKCSVINNNNNKTSTKADVNNKDSPGLENRIQ